jgi:hypothetical protein
MEVAQGGESNNSPAAPPPPACANLVPRGPGRLGLYPVCQRANRSEETRSVRYRRWMARPQADPSFVDKRDDTRENQDIVEIAEQRSAAPRSEDRELDQLIATFGFDPAKPFPA